MRKTISSKIRNKTRAHILTTFTQCSTRIPCQSNKIKETKGEQIQKEEVKLFLFAHETHINIMNTFNKVAGYKINSQDQLHFYTQKLSILRKKSEK
jgi:hypothetical protein